MDIWANCKDRIAPDYIGNELIRVVESQEQIATNSLVDHLEEQAALEHMLEDSKPPLQQNVSADLDYLLTTPFRYPPLKYGSRFGSRFEPSLFYASLSLTTAFAETGYYRFLFLRGMDSPPPSGKFVTQHTVFSVNYATQSGFKLHLPPFSDYEAHLTSPNNYAATQKLGTAMRNQGVTAFEYKSARDINHDLNAALFNPTALTSTKPNNKEQWLCDTRERTVTFYSAVANTQIHVYPLNSYMVDGYFPEPAF